MTADVDCAFEAVESLDVDEMTFGFGALTGVYCVDVEDFQIPFVGNDVPLIDDQIQ